MTSPDEIEAKIAQARHKLDKLIHDDLIIRDKITRDLIFEVLIELIIIFEHDLRKNGADDDYINRIKRLARDNVYAMTGISESWREENK